MNLTEYIILFLLVVTTGAGIPGPGDAAMIAAGTLAGEGRLSIGVVVVTSIAGWLLGSLAGYFYRPARRTSASSAPGTTAE